MKLNERYFYCFGCGATGDVIDLVAKLFDLSSYESAKKLAMTSGLTRISHHAEAERHIKEAGCHTRSDSVRVVEALVTATSEFFHGKKKSEIRAYFQEAMTFLQQNQDPKAIISAVVHMDKKTPHMHLSFVPLTADGRLSA